MPKTTDNTTELVTITGTVVRVFPAVKKDRWTRYDFKLKLSATGEEVACSRFGKAMSEYVGADVQFAAEPFNRNNGTTSYTIKGEIHTIDGVDEPVAAYPDDSPSPDNAQPALAAVRNKVNETVTKIAIRKQATPVVTTLPETTATATNMLAEFSNDAYSIVRSDANVAAEILGTIKKTFDAASVATLVQAIQAVRATLFIEANKREHVANMNARRSG